MFKKLFSKKDKGLSVKAPAAGKIMQLSEVPDEVFSAGIMGNGMAVELAEDKICAPCDGTVALVAETKHAVALNLADGTELLIHVGIDTVMLQGEGFNPLVKAGDAVKTGDPLLEVDRAFIQSKGISLATPVIVCNSSEHPIKSTTDAKDAIGGETELFVL